MTIDGNEAAAYVARHYDLFDYVGTSDADRLIVIMGSGAETVEETVKHFQRRKGGRHQSLSTFLGSRSR